MKNISKVAITLSAIIAISSAGVLYAHNTKTSAAAATPTQTVTQQVTEKATKAAAEKEAVKKVEVKADSKGTGMYDKLVSLVTDEGATGYTCGKVLGSKSYFLVVHYGDAEASRIYKFYEIKSDDVEYKGELGGSHTVLYIDEDSLTLGIYNAHMGNWAYGLVDASNNGLKCGYERNGRVDIGEDYPSIPGEQIELTKTTDTAQLANFN